jgi:hypothetical protein
LKLESTLKNRSSFRKEFKTLKGKKTRIAQMGKKNAHVGCECQESCATGRKKLLNLRHFCT